MALDDLTNSIESKESPKSRLKAKEAVIGRKYDFIGNLY